jgi:hypothetical protein
MKAPLLLLASSLLAGCGGSGNSAADNEAAILDNAAEQSTPAGAAVLENSADQVRAGNGQVSVQGAMEAAGNAQSATPAPPSQGAKPHAPGDPVPPPKTDGGNSQ